MTARVTLERPLPSAVRSGRASVVLCAGTCSSDVEALEMLVDGEPHPLIVCGTRFWGTVPIAARTAPATVSVTSRARAGGAQAEADLATIDVVQAPATASGVCAPGLLAVCMATFEPDMALFRAQVDSLRRQTDGNWVCVISDDQSSPERFAEIEAEVAGDRRFLLSRSELRLGFYRNFERALTMAPAVAELIALCDQDDRWAPDKLATLRAALGSRSVLAYSDLRLVEADGRVLRETLWRGRANNHTDLISMLVANTITGAAGLFRRELLDVLLPFPDTPGFQFHDHWLAVAALAVGEIAYVERPLYDYVQHPGAVFGHVTHGERPTRARAIERWRAAYFYGYLPRKQQAEVVLARAGEALDGAKRRRLERFVAAERSLTGQVWLALRALRVLIGRTETLASELELVKGLMWLRAARRWPGRLDVRFPPLEAFTQKRLRRWRAGIRKT
ncbi:MAG TPA: glycosyltransferase [Solirubrobacteraceae bacterium]|nr:glycosyltransferase [Solirubrobacteraceae bacterium]